jgi:hypothetical protein
LVSALAIHFSSDDTVYLFVKYKLRTTITKMADAAGGAAAAAGQNPNGQRNQQGNILTTILRMGMMWYFFKQFGSKKPADGKNVTYLTPMLGKGTPIDVHFYVTDSPAEPVGWMNVAKDMEPVWVAKDVRVADGVPHIYEYTYTPSAEAQANGSVLVHTVYTPHGVSANPRDADFDQTRTWGFTKELNIYLPKLTGKGGVNLLSGKNATSEDDDLQQSPDSNVTEIISYLKPNVTISFVDEFGYVLWNGNNYHVGVYSIYM